MTTQKKENVKKGACGVAVGSHVDVATALRFDRAQQLKANEQSDERKLQEAREVVARLGGDE